MQKTVNKKTQNTRAELNQFFIDVQARALRQAELATGHRDEAMDILQEAMIKLAKKYAGQPKDWPQLFQRILQNQIRDWHRRKKVRRIITWWQQHEDAPAEAEDGLHGELDESVLKHAAKQSPEMQVDHQQSKAQVLAALQQLPLRQQQAFLLRAWWGHDTEQTAYAMACSQGSVKTHYSRALNKLQAILGKEIAQ